jgi:hypothetical protein
MPVPNGAPATGWAQRLQGALHSRHHQYGDIMWVVRRGCQEIMELHKSRQTECFYERMLACYLYERGIPYMTQASGFVWSYWGCYWSIKVCDFSVLRCQQ